MSKSLGNMVFVRDLLRSHSANAIRLYLLGHHYRQVWEWSPRELEAAVSLASQLEAAVGGPDSNGLADREEFAAALANDLDTPRAIEALARLSGGPLRDLGSVLGLQL
jgi:L-cysteine:1D-myo-inositol 2-amino-2-deoxy-alpha-D-glucopyranoside ligase